MIRITLVNLDAGATHASSATGTQGLGELPPADVLALLQRFRALDSIENVEADPEIVLEMRRRKFVVRTGKGKLYLSNPRNLLEPTLELTPEEIIAEIDGSAETARTRAPAAIAMEASDETDFVPTAPPTVSRLRAPHRIVLGAAAVGLAGYLIYASLSGEALAPAPVFEPITDAKEIDAAHEDLAGVYMTGAQAGHHGIALNADGTMKLFQLNAGGPPSLIQDTFHLGRSGGQFCVLSSQPGGAMQFAGRDSLTFCGETYHRLQ